MLLHAAELPWNMTGWQTDVELNCHYIWGSLDVVWCFLQIHVSLPPLCDLVSVANGAYHCYLSFVVSNRDWLTSWHELRPCMR
jgi:hypothetical protein